MNLTVVIVNYNSADFLRGCLESIHSETRATPFEVVVVDNASRERNFDFLHDYPRVKLLQNSKNLGFAAACNQGIRSSISESYLLLNPDCSVQEGAIDRCVEFLSANPEIGILGCRVTNPDGSLQRACRRQIPRPATAFYRFSGLSFLFPRSRRFAAYNLAYLDENEGQEVEAVSGSFLLFRREVLSTAGYLDEAFFLYGEDLDFCYRTALNGWKVYYYPAARVIHHKRASSSRSASAANFHFYDAMRIFYRKHFYPEASWLERAAVLGTIRLMYWFRSAQHLFLDRKEVGSRG